MPPKSRTHKDNSNLNDEFKSAAPAPVSVPMEIMASRSRSSGADYSGRTSPLRGELNNITSGVVPFENSAAGVSVNEAIVLCQKAYWNVAIFRMTVDIMSEFANSTLNWVGENKAAVEFFEAWYKKIGGWRLGDQFFREWFRSGNIFIYRFDADITLKTVRRTGNPTIVKQIPIKYVLLNPADIVANHSLSFFSTSYNKVLNEYEMQRLKNPSTPDEIEFFNSLPAEWKENIKKGMALFPLMQDRLISIFCKKQDYEAMAVPMYFPVLFDIDLKLEFKKVEKIVARTTDYLVLLITMGNEPEKGGTDPSLLNAMNELFKTESVGRVLIADYTTEAQFILPDLKKILGPEKYQVVNDDIANGLMNIFFGQEKFANSMVKIQVFLERLEEARQAFLTDFLMPEVERISDELGFKNIPQPEFKKVDLKDEVEYLKLYNRLAELGLLTAEETLDAYRTHQLPIPSDSEISQKKFKELKDKGLYEPLIGGAKDKGRPEGAKAPQSTKKVGPIGASEKYFGVTKIQDTFAKINELNDKITQEFKKKNNIKRISKKHKEQVLAISHKIIENEQKDKWLTSIDNYLDPAFIPLNTEVSQSIADIEVDHQVSPMLACLLYHSQCEKPENAVIEYLDQMEGV